MKPLTLAGLLAFALGGMTTLVALPRHSPQIAADPAPEVSAMQRELERSGPLLPLDFTHNMF